MADYFIESPTWAYFSLAALAIIFLFAFFTSKRVLYLGLIGLLAVIGLALFLIDVFVESDNEQVVRFTKEMFAAAEKNDLEGFGKHISARFSAEGETKESILNRAKPLLPHLKSVRGDKFGVEKATMGRVRNVECVVTAKGTVQSHTLDDQNYNVRLGYVRDDDGEWRVRRFEVWNALGNSRYYP